MRRHVNVLIHWGVCGNSTFSLHVRDSPSRDGPSGRERHFESDGDASRTAECHYAHRGGHSTLNLFLICIRAATAIAADVVVVVVAGECSPGGPSRVQTRPHSITRTVSPSSARARTSALEQPASVYLAAAVDRENVWIYRMISLLSLG